MSDDAVTALLVDKPLDSAPMAARARGAGAIASFLGIVRPESRSDGAVLTALEYTAYEPMALQEIRRLANETRSRYELLEVYAAHRLGRLEIGEASILIVARAAHRQAAFDGCRQLLDRIKADAPIFKREVWSQGPATWVQGV